MLRTSGLILCTLVLVVHAQNYQRMKNILPTVKGNNSHEVVVKDGPEADFPCIDAELFLPCICKADPNDFTMEADCSNAVDDDDLAKAFVAEQTFCNFKSLTISPDTPTDLNTLTIDTFGCVGFETIEISGTNLKEIQDGAFANSEDSLTTFTLNNNAIENFPFEALLRFTELKTLNLASNSIGTVQYLESDTLVTLNLNNNPTLDISLGLFGRAPNLETLKLHNCGIEDLTTDMFLSLDSIKTIDLSMNEITQLRQNAINVPNESLEELNFGDNPLFDIAVGAINKAGLVQDTCTLSFENNEFVELCEITWGEYVNHLADGSINLAGNPLRCGCDIDWLFDGNKLNQQLDSSTTCSDGYILQDLIPEVFEYHCDPMPAGICSAAAEQESENM